MPTTIVSLDVHESSRRGLLATVRYCTARATSLPVGVVLLGAGLLKLFSPAPLAGTVGDLLGLPAPAAWPVALAVIAAEVAIGGALVTGRRPLRALPAAAALLLVFIAALALGEWLQLRTACNCFGATGLNLPRRVQMLADGVLLALTLVAWRSWPRAAPRAAPDA